MSKMNRKEFFHAIAEGFFKDLSTDFEGLKDMIIGTAPVFGTLETEITEKKNGGKKITFIDKDEAQLIMVGEGVDPDEIEDIDTDMTSVVMTIHLDEDNVIQIVEHGFSIFTPANKNDVLFHASLIGKKVVFDD